jgi:hypothetical protein
MRTRAPDVAGLREVGVFAERLVGEPLWRHQLDAARSPARFRVLCAGRQVGKTRVLAVIALHAAFTNANHEVLIMSHGEDGAGQLLEELSNLASASPWLAASVEQDDKTVWRLSNGSRVRCVPASQKRVRGKSVDLLILDEAAFIEEELWSAAKYTILARPGSRVIMSSTPYGRRDRFFAQYFTLGSHAKGDERLTYESFHWPSMVSPLVDKGLLKEWRKVESDRIYRREVLAEWVDEAGQYFSSAELTDVTVDYRMTDPKDVDGAQSVVAGVDWGFANDANTLALLGVVDDGTLNFDRHGRDDVTFFVPWIEERFDMPYSRFIDRVVEVGGYRDKGGWGRGGGYLYRFVIAEANGVGSMPCQELRRKMRERGVAGQVYDVHTTARRKEAAFGALKLLIGQGRLILPRHTTLRRQLEGLEFETLDSGLVRIAVPERIGHDDLAMALAQAVSCVRMRGVPWTEYPSLSERCGEALTAPCGTKIPAEPRAMYVQAAFMPPRGGDHDTDW